MQASVIGSRKLSTELGSIEGSYTRPDFRRRIASMSFLTFFTVQGPKVPIGYFATAFLPCYWVFKRYETSSGKAIVTLVVGPPALAAIGSRLVSGENIGYLRVTVLLTLTHTSLLFVLVILYRLSPFHPLYAYPGPVQCKLSKLYAALVTSTGRQHVYYRSLHERYGDIVRVGPNELSIRHVGAVTPILGYGGLPKGPFWDHRAGAEDSHPPLIAVRDPQEHAKRRRPWNRALSRAAIIDYEASIVHNAERLVTALRARAEKPLDITGWMNFFSLDNMGNMVFGEPYGILENGLDEKRIHEIIEEGVRFTAIAGQIPWVIPFLRSIAGSRIPYARMKQFARSSAMERLNHSGPYKDLFYYLNDEADVQSVKRSPVIVASDASMAIVAGSDTTAASLAALWYYLTTNDMAYKRLQREVDTTSATDMNSTKVPNPASMPYLNACINEALRLLPALLGGSQRSVSSGTGGKVIGPFHVPEATQVFVHTYSLHRDPRYFSPLPDSFWPDRWLPESDRIYPPNISGAASEFTLETSAFIPFSYGPTACIGRPLALTVLRTVVYSMMRTFDILPYGENEDWEALVKDYFTPNCGPLMVTLKPR